MFHVLGLSAPQRPAEVKLTEGQGAAPTSALEKAKRKRASSTAAPKKKSRILDEILQQSPLRSKGDSEDGMSGDSNRPSAEAPPFAVEKVSPLKVVPPSLDLEFSTAQESDDDGGGDEVQIEVVSSHRSPAAREADALGHDTKAPSQHDTSSSGFGNEGNSGNDSSSSSDSSSYFIRNADPEAVATELGAQPTAMHLSGNVIKSLRFESGDRERTLLAAAGESFCFPLMERDLMDTRLKNMLENAQDLSLKAFMDARCAARQLKDESSSKSAAADLEVKVAALEQEKATLQQCLEKSTAERDTLATELLATAERAIKAEDAAKAAKKLAEDAESSREVMCTRLRTFKESI